MLTVQLPTLLAVLGTVLMAIVIFAPAPAQPTVTASCAPPLEPPSQQFRAWEPIDDAGAGAGARFDAADGTRFDAADGARFDGGDVAAHEPVPLEPGPAWPALFDVRASGCDAEARRALAAALGAVRTPWAATILQRAFDDEADESVRAAIATALSR
jgi:hypothetical protein